VINTEDFHDLNQAKILAI